MNIIPSLEARVSAQERRQITMDARFEELSEDISSSFKQLSEHLGHIDDRFNKIEADMATVVANQKEQTARLATVETRLTTVETHLTTIETRLTTVETHLTTIETTQKEQTTLLTQILERLPKAP